MITDYPGTFCLVGSAALGLMLTPLAIRMARVWGLYDLPGVRKVHSNPIPTIGGLAISIATVVPIAAIALTSINPFGPGVHTSPVFTLIAASISIMVFGLVDDLVSIRAKYKLLLLLGACAMFCGSGGAIRSITFQGNDIMQLGDGSWPITMLWIVGVTVAINFIDGLDGLAAGIIATASGVLSVCLIWGGSPGLALLPLAWMGALLSFLVFNYNPAKIFMGDCGSMFIGFLFAGCCCLAQSHIGTTRGLLLPALALSIPIFDTLSTFVRRGILQRRSLFSAERGHIHHRLLEAGLCHRHVVMVLHSATLLGASVAVVSLLGNGWATGVVAIAFCAGLVVLFRVAGTVRARETFGAIRRNRALGRESRRHRIAFEELQLAFRDVNDFSSWWNHVCRSAEVFELAKMDLPLTRRDGSETVMKWRRSDSEIAEPTSLTAEIPVPQRRSGQFLRVSVEFSVNNGFLENAGQRLALFSRHLAECSLNELPETVAAQPEPVPSEEGEIPSHIAT